MLRNHRMSVAPDSRKPSSAFGYFVLSYCLLVPFVGTIALFIVLDRAKDAYVFGGAAAFYFSGMVVGLFNLATIKNYGRVEFWASVVGIVLSGFFGMLSIGASVISLIGLPFLS
jgi:hypothetical protein